MEPTAGVEAVAPEAGQVREAGLAGSRDRLVVHLGPVEGSARANRAGFLAEQEVVKPEAVKVEWAPVGQAAALDMVRLVVDLGPGPAVAVRLLGQAVARARALQLVPALDRLATLPRA